MSYHGENNAAHRLVTFHHKQISFRIPRYSYRVSNVKLYYFSALQEIGLDQCSLSLQVRGRRLGGRILVLSFPVLSLNTWCLESMNSINVLDIFLFLMIQKTDFFTCIFVLSGQETQSFATRGLNRLRSLRFLRVKRYDTSTLTTYWWKSLIYQYHTTFLSFIEKRTSLVLY